jgi:hypothetical protein
MAIMERMTFITQYYLNAISGVGSSKSSPKPWEIIDDAEEAWNALDNHFRDTGMQDIDDIRSKRDRSKKSPVSPA